MIRLSKIPVFRKNDSNIKIIGYNAGSNNSDKKPQY